MRTDRVQVALRPRSGFEAVDLGFAMARQWWRPIASTWAAFVLPVGLALCLALREQAVWAIVALWWLRPAFGRVTLHVLSRAIFSEPAGVVETARALPGLLRSGLGVSLLSRRLSPARTFLLPVLQLEGLRGEARRARCAALVRRDLGASVGLLTAGSLLHASLLVGLLLALEVLVPGAVEWSPFEALLGSGIEMDTPLAVPLLYLAGISVIEPLLTAGGFGLYLNRRVDLEGWDIDLAFRRMTRRLGVGPTVRAAALAALALWLAAAPARAECDPDSPATAKPCIDRVLEGPDFGSVQERERWQLRDFGGGEEEESWEIPWPGWLPELVASLFELTLWIGLAVGVIALAVSLARGGAFRPLPLEVEPPPPSLFGLDLDPGSLPEDVVAAARARWDAGERVEALSLLYRGALVHLCEREALEIPDSATELECVGLVRRRRPGDLAASFAALTQAWLGARYAASPPEAADFDELCRRYTPSFGAPA